jgi:hypothetical protein
MVMGSRDIGVRRKMIAGRSMIKPGFEEDAHVTDGTIPRY